MHIETELDEVHAECLLRLQENLQKLLAEVVAKAIDALSNVVLMQIKTHGARIHQILEKEGLIGCIEGDSRLSVDYKNHL